MGLEVMAPLRLPLPLAPPPRGLRDPACAAEYKAVRPRSPSSGSLPGPRSSLSGISCPVVRPWGAAASPRESGLRVRQGEARTASLAGPGAAVPVAEGDVIPARREQPPEPHARQAPGFRVRRSLLPHPGP